MYVKISDLDIYYQEAGKGKDLVLLHGWKQDVSSFWELVELLKNDFKLYLIDLPGFGRSETPKKAFSVSDYAGIVKSFIEEKDLRKPNVLGHSLGGRVTIKLASKNSELINKLILVDAAGIKPKRDPLKVLFYVIAKTAGNLIPNTFNARERLRRAFYKKFESDYLDAGVLKQTLVNILAEDLTSDIKKIENETLLIWGEKDPTREASLANGKKMYRLIKNSRIEVFEGVGHFPHLEKPVLFSNYVRDFL
ncbi:MAG: alpha/beta hydrolase [Candidatus Levybacteria bacterium]|nr:alpha/beta hydrolase [Candidatus Levybacteria bacterium]